MEQSDISASEGEKNKEEDAKRSKKDLLEKEEGRHAPRVLEAKRRERLQEQWYGLILPFQPLFLHHLS